MTDKYEGFFFDYPDEEDVDEEKLEDMDEDINPLYDSLLTHRKDHIKEASKQTQVFERKVLANIQEQEGEEIAAIMEYLIRVAEQGGFWNDPEIYEREWNESSAEYIAERAIKVFKDQMMPHQDKEHILEKAGIK